MIARATEAAAVAIVAAAVTLAIAAPVVRDPSARLFGMPSAGHHHDPFTVMQQFDRPRIATAYLQPVTDVPGALLARAVGPVAAYNWIVLLSFPLSAAAAYLLARHLRIGRPWAVLAGLAFAFSPFHLAHAAYHPHVAQTHWLPIYLLALWRCIDRPDRGAIVMLAAAAAAVILSNAYGGLIAALITPPAFAAYWYFSARHDPDAVRRVATTRAVLAVLFVAGAIHATLQAGAFAPAVSSEVDLVRYSARWWSYLIPPVAHPIAGTAVWRFWQGSGVDVGLIEQQVSLGSGVVLLGVAALAAPFVRPLRSPFAAAVPVTAVIAAVALVLSLAPGSAGAAPSAVVHWLLPMFRAFARFGVVVQLMAVMLAAFGAERLWNLGTTTARRTCMILIALAAAEYAVWPPAMSRPVLPTSAHARVAGMTGDVRVLDCVAPGADAGAIHWLTSGRISQYRAGFADCLEPNFAEKLAAGGFTHLIVRDASDEGQWLRARRMPDGWQRVARFADSDLYAVAAPAPAVHTVSMTRFYPREHDSDWLWRWMGPEAAWWIANNTSRTAAATLDIEIMAARGGLELSVLLDGTHVQSMQITDERSIRRIGPFMLSPGGHEIVFRPDRVTRAAGGDARLLSFRMGTWAWHAAGPQ